MSLPQIAPIFGFDDSALRPTRPQSEHLEVSKPRQLRPKVLVVDDQRLIADTISEILEDAGYHAVAAYDGWSALEAAAKLQPDYLLCDVLMPRMNGVQLAITIRKTYPAAKILLFTGQAGVSEILLEGKKQGYEFDLVPKPIHPLKLIERLKEQQ
jgi:CheY-like chemotaxis protein